MYSTMMIGNLCNDPVFKEVQLKGGEIVHNCKFRIAVNDPYNKDREARFIEVTTWRGAADSCRKYLSKGRKVYVEGILDCNPVAKDGTIYKNLQLNARTVEFLSPKPTTEAPAEEIEEEAEPVEEAPAAPVRQPVRRQRISIPADELPF